MSSFSFDEEKDVSPRGSRLVLSAIRSDTPHNVIIRKFLRRRNITKIGPKLRVND